MISPATDSAVHIDISKLIFNLSHDQDALNAQKWITAWRIAGPELERIRNQELRDLEADAGLRTLGAFENKIQHQHGMVTYQSWMMRLRVKELLKDLEDHHDL